jgi:hypothetical protein
MLSSAHADRGGVYVGGCFWALPQPGGFYDHVPRGPAAPSNSEGEEHGFRFNQLGARVPAVVISPFVPQGTIEHRLLEHSSIVKTVCELFEVPLLHGNRDLNTVCGFGHLASLPAARTDTPERLPDAVVAPFPNVGRATDPHRDFEMLHLSVRLAALHDAELRPGEHDAIERRVAALQTPEEAAVYVKEVNERIGALEPTQRSGEQVKAQELTINTADEHCFCLFGIYQRQDWKEEKKEDLRACNDHIVMTLADSRC